MRLHGNQVERSVKKQNQQQYLNKQNSRHTIYKLEVPCLVAEGIHTGNRTNTAADDGDDKEGGFRNPEGTLYCFSFIDSHKGEGKQIDCCKICCDKQNHHHNKISKLFVRSFFQLHGTHL